MRDDDVHDAPAGGIGRRTFFKVLGVAGAAASGLVPLDARAAGATKPEDAGDPFGVLVDTTRCVGCRTCEMSCAQANGLPEPDLEKDAFVTVRDTSETARTVVNRYQTTKGEVYAKKQCMHCVQPACASACLTKAMLKTEEGPVVWRANKCMGCRFCMVSCPFDVPKFEYHSAVPSIHKCTLCSERVAGGGKPACVENCPMEALTFGRRSELINEANNRIQTNPGQYVSHIYGEHEAGGTSWMYLAGVPFQEIGLQTAVGTTAYPEFTKPFLYTVPLILTLGPAFLLGLSNATKAESTPEKEEASDVEHGLRRHDAA